MKSANRAALLPNWDSTRPQWGSLWRQRRRPAREKWAESPASADPRFQPGNRFPCTKFLRHAAPSPTGIRGEPCLPLGWRLLSRNCLPRPPLPQLPPQPPSPTPIPRAWPPTDWFVSGPIAAYIKCGTRLAMESCVCHPHLAPDLRKLLQLPPEDDDATVRAAYREYRLSQSRTHRDCLES